MSKSITVSISKGKECFIYDEELKHHHICKFNGSQICFNCRIFSGNEGLSILFMS